MINQQSFSNFTKVTFLIIMAFLAYTAHEYVNADRYEVIIESPLIYITNSKNGNTRVHRHPPNYKYDPERGFYIDNKNDTMIVYKVRFNPNSVVEEAPVVEEVWAVDTMPVEEAPFVEFND